VIGRVHAEPDRMKPSPEPILRAVIALDAKPKHCVLIGDSLTDITGSRAAGVRVIGYANKPPRIESFTKAGADFVVTSMAEVAAASESTGVPDVMSVGATRGLTAGGAAEACWSSGGGWVDRAGAPFAGADRHGWLVLTGFVT
jgi:hypothetical protein